MADSDKLIEVFLQPGEYFVGDAGFRVSTLLGSCVSITLWHAGLRVGAMSHFLLARSSLPAGATPRTDGRYGNDALRLMLGRLEQAGVPRAGCRATITGGGNMFPSQMGDGQDAIGHQNGIAARQLLQQAGIPVAYEHLFGLGHRQLLFNIGSGEVWVRQLAPACERPSAIAAPFLPPPARLPCQPSTMPI